MPENINAEREFGGYTLSAPNLDTELAYVKHLEECTIAKVHSHRAAHGPEYRDVLKELDVEFGMGALAWGSKAWAKSLQNDDHLIHLAWLMFGQKHPDMTRDQCEDIVEAHTVIGDDGQPTNEVVTAIIELVNLPNRRGRRRTAAAPDSGSANSR